MLLPPLLAIWVHAQRWRHYTSWTGTFLSWVHTTTSLTQFFSSSLLFCFCCCCCRFCLLRKRRYATVKILKNLSFFLFSFFRVFHVLPPPARSTKVDHFNSPHLKTSFTSSSSAHLLRLSKIVFGVFLSLWTLVTTQVCDSDCDDDDENYGTQHWLLRHLPNKWNPINALKTNNFTLKLIIFTIKHKYQLSSGCWKHLN